MKKLDFKKVYKDFYTPKPSTPEIVVMPKMQFAMIDGEGDPNISQDFQDAVTALDSVLYGLKFARKKENKEPDFSIGPLEGLWRTKSGKPFNKGEMKDWSWTVMIWVPDFISHGEFVQIIEAVKHKKPNPMLPHLRLESYSEGRSVQIMHIGPYSEEQANVELMHAHAHDKGYAQSGAHHEIYLSDPRRVAPDKMRTIIRHPIAKI